MKAKGKKKLSDAIVAQKCWLLEEQLALRKSG